MLCRFKTCLLFSLLFCAVLRAEGQADTSAVFLPQGFPVVFEGDTLFSLQSNLGPFTSRQRGEAIIGRLEQIVHEDLDPRAIRMSEAPGYTTISLDSITILAVTNADASIAGRERSTLAKDYVSVIRTKVGNAEQRSGWKANMLTVGEVILLLGVTIIIFALMKKVFPAIYSKLQQWEGSIFRPIQFRSRQVLSAENLSFIFIAITKGLRFAVSLVVLNYSIDYIVILISLPGSWNIKPVAGGILLSVFITVILFTIFKALNVSRLTLDKKIIGWKGTLIKSVRLKTIEIISEERIVGIAEACVKAAFGIIVLVALYFYLTILFSFFSFTKTWAATLFRYILHPLSAVFSSAISFLPNLFFIVVIVVVTRYALKLIRLFFNELGKGTIALPGFYHDWAEPTYKIARFLVFAFAAVVVFPYLPGSSSPAFQGISVFLGILFSLGSTSAVANIVAGTVLTYMRPFKIGDRVKIADTMGDVMEKTLLVTRVQTIKNVEVTIPNAMVLGSHIINFSSSAAVRGLILHTTVTIGYNAPWRKVHELLKAAAKATENILPSPEPFVLQTSLDDFYVSYELNAYTNQPNKMQQTYSALHQNIQDKFNEGGIEIASPHYAAVRDGNEAAVPDEYLPKHSTVKGFKIFPSDQARGESGNH
jgi:small-conductance mechanosensitive channel